MVFITNFPPPNFALAYSNPIIMNAFFLTLKKIIYHSRADVFGKQAWKKIQVPLPYYPISCHLAVTPYFISAVPGVFFSIALISILTGLGQENGVSGMEIISGFGEGVGRRMRMRWVGSKAAK
jgi:hypothetical protein